MKRLLSLILSLLLAVISVPALAEGASLPECFIPTTMMMQFNISLPDLFKTLGNPEPSSVAEKYLLSNPDMSGNGMRFSSDDGNIVLECNSGPMSTATNVSLSIAGGTNAIDATALKFAFLKAVSNTDSSVAYEDLVSWLTGDDDVLSLDGYSLTYKRDGGDQILALTAGGVDSKADPSPTESTGLSDQSISNLLGIGGGDQPIEEDSYLPPFFIPQIAATYFNGLLGQTLEMLGTPDPEALAEQYSLTKADIVNDVLFLSSADGRVEISAYYEDGKPEVDRQATTLGLSLAKDVDRSELLSLGATFAFALSQIDNTVTDFDGILNWMSDSVDGGDGAVYSLNGYNLVYAKGDNGYIFTLVPTSSQVKAETTPAPTPEPTLAPVDESVLFSWEGYSVRLLSYKIYKSTNSTASLRLYVRVINNTDRTLSLWCNDATADGVSVVVAPILGVEPHTDTGEDDPQNFYVFAGKENKDAASNAIAAVRRIKGTLLLRDSDSSEELVSKPVSIELDDLEGIRDINTPRPTATPKPEANADFGHGGAYAPASTDYSVLKKGSKGQAVRDLQQRLIDLGYLYDKADGSYGKKTVAAVRLFCEQNGLTVYADGSASPEMQARLFSSSAKGYSEMYNPLTISRGKWDPVRRANTFFFKAEVTNTSQTRTIKGFELNCYTTNVWGDKLDGGVVYTMSNKVTVKPGKTGWSNSFNLGNWYSVDTVWIGVSRIIFDDGEIRDIDNVNYYSCVLPDKK